MANCCPAESSGRQGDESLITLSTRDSEGSGLWEERGTRRRKAREGERQDAPVARTGGHETAVPHRHQESGFSHQYGLL